MQHYGKICIMDSPVKSNLRKSAGVLLLFLTICNMVFSSNRGWDEMALIKPTVTWSMSNFPLHAGSGIGLLVIDDESGFDHCYQNTAQSIYRRQLWAEQRHTDAFIIVLSLLLPAFTAQIVFTTPWGCSSNMVECFFFGDCREWGSFERTLSFTLAVTKQSDLWWSLNRVV